MRSGRRPWLWGMVGVGLVFAFFFLMTVLVTWLLTGEEGLTDAGTRIGVVAIEGVISSELTERAVRQLTRYGDDASVKAIILRIDSPGGGVAASQEIYEEVRRVRSGGKLVVASMGSVAASGGYYVASVADRIFANAGTITGSIGVIVQLGNAAALLHKLGIESTVITSGPFKDSGNPTRPLRPENGKSFKPSLTMSTSNSSKPWRRGGICPWTRFAGRLMGAFTLGGARRICVSSTNSEACKMP
jgi:protease-4